MNKKIALLPVKAGGFLGFSADYKRLYDIMTQVMSKLAQSQRQHNPEMGFIAATEHLNGLCGFSQALAFYDCQKAGIGPERLLLFQAQDILHDDANRHVFIIYTAGLRETYIIDPTVTQFVEDRRLYSPALQRLFTQGFEKVDRVFIKAYLSILVPDKSDRDSIGIRDLMHRLKSPESERIEADFTPSEITQFTVLKKRKLTRQNSEGARPIARLSKKSKSVL
jgi:hypothetical protein